MSPQPRSNTNDAWERLGKGLGWFSIGLGLSELIAPGAMADFIGVCNSSGNRSVMRAYGMREIAAGLGILMQERPVGWMWARVGGDLLDFGSLAASVGSRGSSGRRLAGSIGAVAGVTALDFYCASQLDRLPRSRSEQDQQSIRASNSAVITIDRPADNLYRRLRDFMRTRGEGGESRIFTSGVEITEDAVGQRLRWRAHPMKGIAIAGNVRFSRPHANSGTVVRAELESPSGRHGGSSGREAPRHRGKRVLQNELRKFKQLVETGEIATSAATAEAGVHQAQPPQELAHA